MEVEPGRRGWLRHPGRQLRLGVDVVHLHSAAALIRDDNDRAACWRAVRVLAGLAWLRLRGVTLVWTAHDLEDHDRQRPRLEYAFTWVMSRLVSGILSHGERANLLVAERLGLPRARQPRAVPIPAFDPSPPLPREQARRRLLPDADPAELVFLFFGSVKEYRGIHELLGAFDRIARPGLRLVIRGPVKDTEVERAIDEACGRCPEIDFSPGFVPEADAAAWLAAADVVVAPYRRILTSGSVGLAMSQARPCVAPRMGTIPEQLDETCGLLYDPHEPSALEKALVRAIDTRSSLVEMGSRARERALRFGWRDAARETAAFYRELRAR